MEITIRQAHSEELSLVAYLANAAYSVPFKDGAMVTKANDNEEKIIEEIKTGATVFVALSDENIVGSVRCCLVDKNLNMYKLTTDPNFRNLGIGGKLINYVFNFAKTKTVENIFIEVTEEKALVPYYKSFGFSIVGEKKVKDHYEVDMVKAVV